MSKRAYYMSISADLKQWTIITVCFNSARHLNARWKSIPEAGGRWIVLDNCSSDGSAELAKDLGAEVVRLPSNIGFARANNVALKMVNSVFVAFVNPDVWIDYDTFERLGISCTERRALVAPQLVNLDGSTQANGRGMPYLFDKLAHRNLKLPGSRLDEYLADGANKLEPYFVTWVIGAAVCGRRVDVLAAGGWDERYFLYYEDHQLGLDAWRAGIPVMLDPGVRWIHEWERATMRWEIRPWRREIASAVRFYARHPFLVLPFRATMSARFDRWKRAATGGEPC